MSSIIKRYNLLNLEIEKKLHNGDIEQLIELCRSGMDMLPEVVSGMKEVPRRIPCRDVLIQSYAKMDQFDDARFTADQAYKARTYSLEIYQAVLRRIDEMAKVQHYIFASLTDNPEMPESKLRKRLSCDKKALEWYLLNSRTIKKNFVDGVCKLSLPDNKREIDLGVKAALVDVETTGLSRTKDEIVEIGVMLVRINEQTGEMMEVMEEINELNKPSFPIPERVAKIHGIRDKDVAGKSITFERFERIFDEADLLVAHNAGFDSSFIQRYFPSTKYKPWHCSVRGVQWKQYGFATRKLLDLCRMHHITEHQTHRALDDVKLTLNLLQQQNPVGDFYMKELLRNPYQAPIPAKSK